MKRSISKIRVIYADTDALGIVYHTNYIKWFEIGRGDLFRDMGSCYAALEARGFHLPVTEAYCQYLVPARYDQILRLETEIEYIGRAVVRFNCEIWDEAREVKHVEGYTIHACTTRKGKVARIPEDIIDRIHQYNKSLE